MMRKALIAGLLALSTAARAQDSHHHGAAGAMPSEVGQSAFAAAAEIVAMLQADPATDWTKVDIGALQAHLVDMDAVFLHAHAEETDVDGGLSIAVTGDGPVADSVRRMVTAHAPQLDALDGMTAAATPTDTGATLQVTSDDPAMVQQIRALGFFGLLTTGVHHQAHHWAIATGGSPHAH